MFHHRDMTDEALRAAIRRQEVALAGHAQYSIFGQLNCRSGMRMKRINRVFFMDQAEAVAAGYRPCGHCMRASYLTWRADR